jgi:DNA-binding MarR family transcriptional regulator
VGLTAAGEALFQHTVAQALAVSERTLEPLNDQEQAQLLTLLSRLT